MKNAWRVVVAALIALGVGCASKPEFKSDRPILVFPEAEGTFKEDVSARKGHPAPPVWLYRPESYPHKRPGCLYFVGISFPRATLQAARDSAFEDAQRQIVRYMGTTVGVKTEHIGTAVGDTRGGGYEAVTDRILSTTVAKETVSKLYVRDRYYTAGTLVQDIVRKPVHLAYALVEFGPQQAQDIAERANAETQKEIKQLEGKKDASPAKKLETRDQIRLESLKELKKKLDNLSIDDFKL